ncbi:hypothetical protein GWK36_09605 [Caldichromatium japonicum]|uniref:Uncharacterized protein n=1 Tax=Caldichromatium japonicum TaxID=2699430 RepID=A0A6G7VDR9_9GAMM|nr:hypothetical protein [Caldichromatium japonicum]QIK38189.1 hypothetical protein GWK36_09605 [Caldichromatium japonicum]
MIYSFDLFDTLITRRLGTPRGVFVLMQQRLLQDPQDLPLLLCADFARERVAAEWTARAEARAAEPDASLQVEEVGLTAIYACFGRRHGLTAEQLEQLIDCELATESECLYGVPEMLDRFQTLAERGERLVLISDMYLRRQDLTRLLDAIDPRILACATLYLSSEIKLNKASGRLFDHVARLEGVSPSEIIHIGDNPISDLQSPRARGCQADLFAACHLTPDEQVGADEYDLGWQVSAGLLREARLTLESDRARVGALYAAPLLVPFVQWAIEEARAQGFKQVYFLARDGQVLIEIARRLGVKDLELRYLYVSRLSCRRALDRDYPALLDWAFLAHRPMSLQDLAYRLTSEPAALIARLRLAADLPLAPAPDQPLDRASSQALRALLETDPLRSWVLEQTAQERARLSGYLAQEGVRPGKRVCLVDLGWSGSIQDALHGLSAGEVEFLGLYWGLMHWGQANDQTNRKLALAFAPGRFWRDPSALREILECFTAADHGSTLGYEAHGGGYRPVLNEEGEAIRAWGLAELRAGIDWFAERVRQRLTPAELIALLPGQLKRLEYLVEYPSPLLAQALADFPYSPDPTGRLLPFAPPLSPWLALTYRLRPSRSRAQLTRWYEGSLINSSPLVRSLAASPLRWGLDMLAALHPRALLLAVPYPLRQWLKHRLPAPLVRASRALLRSG